jgi:uncharacterized protein YxjI
MNPRFIVEQKITAMVNRYAVYSVLEDGSKGAIVAFAQQKRLAFKEKVNFFTDDTKQALAFTLRAEKVMDIHGKFLVEDTNGSSLGYFKKEFKQSLVNSTWSMFDTADALKLTVSESNKTLAIARRFIEFIPIIGDVAAIALNFVKYHFSFYTADGVEVGTYQKTTLFRDHYILSMNDDAYAAQDWRVFVAMSIALDALQQR